MSQPSEVPLCASCGHDLEGRPHFCPHCNAPCDGLAVTGPYETILSRGWVFRKSQQSRSLIVLIGVWLIWVPIAVFALGGWIVIAQGIAEWARWGRLPSMGERFLFVCLVAISAIGFYIPVVNIMRSTQFYLQHKNDPPLDDEDEDGDGETVEQEAEL